MKNPTKPKKQIKRGQDRLLFSSSLGKLQIKMKFLNNERETVLISKEALLLTIQK